jgi:hypothetical protein
MIWNEGTVTAGSWSYSTWPSGSASSRFMILLSATAPRWPMVCRLFSMCSALDRRLFTSSCALIQSATTP